MNEQPTAEEIIAEVRSIAEAMAIRDVEPGFISGSMKHRASGLLVRAGVPLGPWAGDRQYLTKSGTVTFNGEPALMQVRVATVDTTVGEVCRAIVGHLLLVNWKIHPEYHDWTPETAEAAICKAAAELPGLCDRLEQIPPNPKTPETPETASVSSSVPERFDHRGFASPKKAAFAKATDAVPDCYTEDGRKCGPLCGTKTAMARIVTANPKAKPDALDQHHGKKVFVREIKRRELEVFFRTFKELHAAEERLTPANSD